MKQLNGTQFGTNVQTGIDKITANKRIFSMILCFFLGGYGVHRFYNGKFVTGVLFALTGGFCGIGIIIDMILLILKKFKDKNGNIVL